MTSRTLAAIFLASALTITGCKHPAAPETSSGSPTASSASTLPPPAPRIDPATAGTITGVVKFDGKPPARVPIDMSMDPACAMAATPNTSESVVVNDHLLQNVYIYIKSGIPDASVAPGTAPIVLDQKGCRYVPHVIAVQLGGTVEFRNSDPTMHNIHTTPTDGSASVDVSEGPMGAPQTEHFDKVETMLPVRCNNHPWMQAYINVAPNPYFAVTGANGGFVLPNLPPGTYTIAAVQESLGEKDIQVTVPAKGNVKADFTFTAK